MSEPLTNRFAQAHLLRASLLAALLACANSLAADVLVVTDRQHPISVRPGIRVIELDLSEQLIESALATGLPSNPEKAASMVRRRLEVGSAMLQKRLALAYQGIIDAWALGIAKIPAVVVDRRYVVYGEPDVDRALSMVERHRSGQP